ncbi:MAG: Asp-tRNA(Asn)/Glu-tRNA(Gln) amidotransferase subunit GatC [Peptostreptococcaceae bacterium]|jgi:aspartyl-tRNA(Asn)/glutamyl-tRNA(Gln) amidotransferase subunit C|nr:Asp-tRNA(Asn)/Glu-tRNA(Gln) amidotransferase subunit GatC [Peptostreptococcaceae bacterium]
MITDETIKHVANLSKLEFKEDEFSDMKEKLSSILGHIDELTKLDTKDVKITYNPNDTKNVFREDEIKESLDRELALSNANDKEVGCFKVPKVLND